VALGALAMPSVAGAQSFDDLLERSNRHAVRDWYPDWRSGEVGSSELAVRPAASHALALAVGGQPRLAARVLDRLAQAQPRWGGQWQSAYWAAELGLAALLIEDGLDRGTLRRARRAVGAEADRFVGYEVPYFRRHGVVLTPGDTKGEENAWQAMLLRVAAALRPAHPHRAAWRRKNRELVVSALARPQDTHGRYERLLDGGSNVNADFTVTNHDVRDHPDYAAAVLGETGFQQLVGALTGAPPSCAALLNHAGIYARLTERYEPGGTIRHDSPDPLVDGRPPFGFALVDLQARLLGYGGPAAAHWQRRHLALALHPRAPWPAPYGDGWNRGLLASVAARGVLLERVASTLRARPGERQCR
jgi:hypothetical protein